MPIGAPTAAPMLPLGGEQPPVEVQLNAVEENARIAKGRIMARAKLREKFMQLREEYRRDFSATLGPEAFAAYQQATARASQHRETIRLLSDHAGRAGAAESMNRTVVSELENSLAQANVDVVAVKRVQAQFRSRAIATFREIFPTVLQAEPIQILKAVVMVPLASTVQHLVAPFTGQAGTADMNYSAGTCYASHHENYTTGVIETYTNLLNDDTGNSDWAHADATSEVQFLFKMPVAGRVDLTAYLQALETHAGGWMADEWGVSDAHVEQQSYLIGRISNAVGSTTKNVELFTYVRGEQEGSWAHEAAAAGAIVPLHVTSDDPYPAGEWVLCSVGIDDHNFFALNDESCWSQVRNRMVLRSAEVKIL